MNIHYCIYFCCAINLLIIMSRDTNFCRTSDMSMSCHGILLTNFGLYVHQTSHPIFSILSKITKYVKESIFSTNIRIVYGPFVNNGPYSLKVSTFSCRVLL